jgi:hypothetical protein
MSELKPCPSGHTDIRSGYSTFNDSEDEWIIFCNEPDCGWRVEGTRQECESQWNTRQPDPIIGKLTAEEKREALKADARTRYVADVAIMMQQAGQQLVRHVELIGELVELVEAYHVDSGSRHKEYHPNCLTCALIRRAKGE